MVKKLQKMAEKKAASPAGLLDSQLAQTVKESAQQIWLAGLGAFAKAQGEGTKMFETLIKEGVNLHRKTQAAAGEKIGEKLGDVAGKMSAMAGEVGSKANAQWDKLETIFEERTARAMGKLGVPTAKDVAALAERVDALAAAVAKLGGTVNAPAKATRKAPARAAKAAAPKAKKAAKSSVAEAGNGATKPAAKRRVARKAAAPVEAAAE
jgi:poly(hydroxyalkanoate) granule-associated protein